LRSLGFKRQSMTAPSASPEARVVWLSLRARAVTGLLCLLTETSHLTERERGEGAEEEAEEEEEEEEEAGGSEREIE